MAKLIYNRNLPRIVNACYESFIQQCRWYHEVTGDIICPSMVQGIDRSIREILIKTAFQKLLIVSRF